MNNPRSIFTSQRSFVGKSRQNPGSNPESGILQRRYSTSSIRDAEEGSPKLQLPLKHPIPPHAPSPSPSATFPPPLAAQGPVLKHSRTFSGISSTRATADETFLRSEAVSNPVPNPLPAQTTKRSLPTEHHSLVDANSEHAQKKRRVRRRLKYYLDPSYFPSGPSVNTTTPPSPLFFSNSPQPHPKLPPRFSSSEAGEKMLSNTRGEESGLKTVTLARGSINSGSPPPSRRSPRSHGSMERSSISLSTPDSGERLEQLSVLSQSGIVELLEQDERPTFIVDIGDATNSKSGPLHPIFTNLAFRSYVGLVDKVCGREGDSDSAEAQSASYLEFKSWILESSSAGGSPVIDSHSFALFGLTWTSSTLRKRLRVISGTVTVPPIEISRSQSLRTASTARVSSATAENGQRVSNQPMDLAGASKPEEPQDYFGAAGMQSNLPETHRPAVIPSVETPEVPQILEEQSDKSVEAYFASPSDFPDQIKLSQLHSPAGTSRDAGFFDWTRLPVSDALPAHIQFARSVDWASTSLGPIENWSADLRQMCNLVMASPHPAAMYWGEDLVAIYNEAYVLLAGQKHPKLMGQSYREAWAEIWEDVKDVFANAKSTGQATMKDDDCLFIKRSNIVEEAYFSWSIIPLVGADGSVMGLYNPAFEKTRRKIAERRMLTLREVGERTAAARDLKGFWGEVLTALEYNEFDTPFILLYSVSEDSDSDDSSINSSSLYGGRQCYLEGALGVPLGHASAPQQIDLKTGLEGFGPVFREVMKTQRPLVLSVENGNLPLQLMEGLEWRGFGDAATSAVVCPIHPTTSESTLGFLVLGTNPRRPYDDDYALFVQLLSRQLATSLASVVLFEEEIRRGQRAAKLAALEKIGLSEQLAQRTQEAMESESKFTRMAEFAPVGMFIADSGGHVTYCNDTWYDISRVPKNSHSTDRWIEYVSEEDKADVVQLWDNLVNERRAVTAEFRFKAPWLDRHGAQGDTWVLFSAYPEKYEEGTLKSVFGSITNISQQKWAEGFQKRKMEEAVELKRQQENFIDITSHEMRNPLSAILQCADMVFSSMNDMKLSKDGMIDERQLESSIDAAQTIALCALHQKRIIDDVLTMSKLDSKLLMVTPVDVQPLNVVHRALKMFEGELQTADIQLKFVVDESFKQLGIDWVRCDPSRVLQVLINLTTNAIKFTTTQSKRTILVCAKASLQNPSTEKNPVVNYFPSRSQRRNTTSDADWGDGEEVYLQFIVKDTGRGLTEEEKKLLFLRFSQASPRTHVQYGGSGLGLFISRELTELQGGEIGVASEAGKGSTFAFFVKARRSTEPPDYQERISEPVSVTQKAIDMQWSNGSNPAAPKAIDFAPGATINEPQEVLTVLVVEDNLVNQRVLQKQLQNSGCVVYVANHGGEALEFLKDSSLWSETKGDAKDLSVVLMDQEMPVMDGLTCTKRIRELEQNGQLLRHVPIIAVTANARSEQIQTAFEAGMDDVVSKPFRIPELMPKMQELAAKYRPSASAGAVRAQT